MKFSKIQRKLANRLNLRKWISSQNVIGEDVLVGKSSKVNGSYLSGKILIGDHCKIYRSELFGTINIGNYTSLWGPNINLNASINPIHIGNFCSIAKNVTIQEYNHDHTRFTTYFIEQNLFKIGNHKTEIISKGAIKIEHDVWIGTNCVILSGTHISTGAVIAAGSIVTGFIPPYSIVGGAPAKVIKYRFSEEVRSELLKTEWWNWDAEKIKGSFALLNEITRQ